MFYTTFSQRIFSQSEQLSFQNEEKYIFIFLISTLSHSDIYFYLK
ncbi:hypothetical protein XBKB1_1080002 [Xenorhabdus bovienii str. kraussei Becker Underwood]|uniref:Uncharacterized protein n=1 Tax=Xenorhabdus bovienii str. kraussei Becker Underwood TaxID=1398204 RepID=A0A077PQY0_XENBV|nr:hypothetical protein XBKB1_1080002 [Xenorhabdus bovienii str. kraussei Becker Underwood]